MVDIKEKRSFQNFWTRWRKYLDVMVQAKGAKLLCPGSDLLQFTKSENGYIASPAWPICFQTLPQKGTSVSGAHRLVVFINGSFTFSTHAAIPTETQLISVDSNVAFFRPELDNQKFTLDLIDAYHFDHFVEDPKLSAPHPVFHAQRNIRGDDLFPKFQQALETNPNNNMIIGGVDQDRKNSLFGLKTFRLPTPQVDLFSLSAIIAADHLVDKCSHDSEQYINFRAFLKHIGEQNSALVSVKHQRQPRAKAADPVDRFVWQWYSSH